VCLDYLRHVGIEWSPHPTDDDVRREYERMWSLIGHRSVEELINLPLMVDAESLATVDVLTKVGPPSLFTDSNLHSMVLCRAVNLSLEHGNSDGSCVHYVGLKASPRVACATSIDRVHSADLCRRLALLAAFMRTTTATAPSWTRNVSADQAGFACRCLAGSLNQVMSRILSSASERRIT
jgi:hypothetical protein